MDLHRIDPKHFRWFQEVTGGGSLLLHRPGASPQHGGPDGLSKNVEGRDRLIMARLSDWTDLRNRIRGICESIARGEADDEEPEALTIEAIEKADPERVCRLITLLEANKELENGSEGFEIDATSEYLSPVDI